MVTPVPQLCLYLLGSPRIEREGKLVKIDTRKAVAIMAYLSVNGEMHTRDALATMFWPELDQSRARAAFRRTLSALRKGVGEERLLVEGDAVGLNQDSPVWVDAGEFDRLLARCGEHGHQVGQVCPLCMGPISEAVALYRGDFLEGFTLRDSPGFDDWQFFETERLRRTFAGALERLVACYLDRGEPDSAIEFAKRWLSLDPLHEPAHRQLMLLYALTGQRSAALRQYRRCVRTLEEELGVPPLEETTRLYQDILENRVESTIGRSTSVVVPAPRTTEKRGPQVAGTYPLVGRAAEWAALLAAYGQCDPDGYFFAIQGEAGVGKTRLAEEFLAYVESNSAHVMAARCYSGQGGLAYGPFIDGIRTVFAGSADLERLRSIPPHWLSEAARLFPAAAEYLPSDLEASGEVEGLGVQARLFEGARQLLRASLAGPPTGVLFIDDLQWADAASLNLLEYLVRRPGGFPVFILGVWRPEGDISRLEALLAESSRAGVGAGRPLDRLTRQEVDELCQAADLPENTVPRLFEETEGLPFFVVEYLDMVRQEDEWTVPRSVQDLQRARLAGLDETETQLLAAAAVIGRSFDFDTVRDSSGRAEMETIAGVEALLARGLIRERQGGDANRLEYDFSHDTLREIVYQDTSMARRRLLHRRVAESLVNQNRGSQDGGGNAVRIAYHLHLAGVESKAAGYYKLAGDYARRLYANEEAIAHYQSALALGYEPPARLHEAIGDLQTLRGDYSAAVNSLETAAALSPMDALPRLEHKLGNLHQRRGDLTLAACHFQSGLDILPEGENLSLRSQIYADWSHVAARQGDMSQAEELARQALDLAQAGDDLVSLVQAHNILAILARKRDDHQAAVHHLEQALAAEKRAVNPVARAAALNNLALVYADQGDYKQAVSLTQTALDLAARLGDRHREAALLNNLADLYHAMGDSEASMAHLKRAVEIFAEIGVQAGDLQPEIWKLTEW